MSAFGGKVDIEVKGFYFCFCPKADIADFCDAWGTSTRRARLRLQPGLDGFEQPEAHRAVVACERDHKAYSPMVGGVGIARQGADAGNGAGLEERAVAAA